MIPGRWPDVLYASVATLILSWNVLHAGRAVQLQRGSRATRWLSALCGLLVAPALVIAITSVSLTLGRATHIVAWVWPLTAALFLLHSLITVGEGSAMPAVGIPVALVNLVVFASSAVRYANGQGLVLPSALGALGLAEATSLGSVFGRAALVSPLALALPVLTPVLPARGRIGRLATVSAALLAATAALLYVSEYPRAVRALESFSPFGGERLQEHSTGTFALGVRILPELTGTPSSTALDHDLALVATLGADVIAIEVTPAGARGAALDALARALDDVRRDSTLLIVTLGFDRGDDRRVRRSAEAYLATRLSAVEQTMRRLHPDILVPARDPATAGRDALGTASLSYWTHFLAEAAARAHLIRPRTQVGVAASSFTAFDSALFTWASGPSSPMDLAGFTLAPSYGGGASLAAQLRVAGRWARTSARPLWVFGAGTPPTVFGERGQAQALWGVLGWATSQPGVRGVVVDAAADYRTLVGMRAPSGRLRTVATTFERAQRALAEAASVRP